MGELHWYINQQPSPADAGTAMETLEYLEACNLLFERGFLSHDRVRSTSAEVLQNINNGFRYFTNWLDSLLTKGMFAFTISVHVCMCLFLHLQTLNSLILPILKEHSCHGKVRTIYIYYMLFISICIAWDLLRIDVYSFRAICEWFFKTYPTYFVSPLRLSGSAVESLFSQYKHAAGGKLDAVNYTTARAACLVRQSVAVHHSGKGYRDEALHTTEIPLKKTKYNKQHTSK